VLSHHTPQPFYSPFSGTTRVSRCQKRTWVLELQGSWNLPVSHWLVHWLIQHYWWLVTLLLLLLLFNGRFPREPGYWLLMVIMVLIITITDEMAGERVQLLARDCHLQCAESSWTDVEIGICCGSQAPQTIAVSSLLTVYLQQGTTQWSWSDCCR